MWCRVTSGWTRFVTFLDLVRISQAAGFGLAGGLLLLFVFPVAVVSGAEAIGRLVVIDTGVSLLLVLALRAVPRIRRDWIRERQGKDNRRRVLILGVSEAEELLLRSIQNQPHCLYDVAGLISRESRELGSWVWGVPVIGTLGDWTDHAARLGIEELLVVSGSHDGNTVREILDQASRLEIPVQVVPTYEQLLSGSVRVVPRPVSIEDLLHRDPIQLHTEVLSNWIAGRVVLVTGAAGSIGSELVRQLHSLSPKLLLLLDRSEQGVFELRQQYGDDPSVTSRLVDVSDRSLMHRVFAQYRPQIVFHAAAFKHVPLLEDHPAEAVKNIVGATATMADLSREYRAESFVLISTDKAVAPSSVMGACKRVAERYLQTQAEDSPCRMVAVRFGNVLDSAGSVVPIFRKQIADRRAITVTHPDMKRFFMTIPEAAQLVLHAGAMGSGGEIFVLKMGQPVRIVDLARDLIRLSGLIPGLDVPIEFTGLRPGEKIEERLFDEGETLDLTSHPAISVVKTSPFLSIDLPRLVQRIVTTASSDERELRSLLVEMVPEYRPSQEIESSVGAGPGLSRAA